MSKNKRDIEILHDSFTKEIHQHPKILGLENIVFSARESNMFREDYSLYHQPDNILFDYSKFKIYNIEYKTHGNRDKAVKQLRDTAATLRKLFRNYDITNLYIHDNYKIEEIK